MAGDGLLEATNRIIAAAAERDPWLRALRPAGIGYATVELERAAEDLAAAFVRAGLDEPSWEPAPRDELLGAAAWVSRTWWPRPGAAPDEILAVVLLEPDTEGRLAATLARFGEGVAAVYLGRPPRPAGGSGGPGGSGGSAGLPIDSARLGAAAAGPIGRARLLLSRPAWGPNVLVLDG